MSSARDQVYQFKFTIKNTKPPIWRRVNVMSDITLDDLNYIIWSTMNWNESDNAEFMEKLVAIDPDTRIVQLFHKIPQTISYIYDRNIMNWQFSITFEGIKPVDPSVAEYPICISGRLASPIQACDGPKQWESYIEAFNTESNPDHEIVINWATKLNCTDRMHRNYLFDPESVVF